MIKQIVFLLSLLLVFVGSVHAQQDPLLTHFIFNKMSFNPGSTGIDEGFSATAIYRNQWGGIPGAPNTSILNLEGNINRFFPGGVGINFYHDAIGYSRQNNVLLNYSYPLEIGSHILGIGIGIGMQSFGMKPSWITPDQSSAGLADKSLPIGFNSAGLDLNFGLYFKSANGFYVGLSSTHLNAASIKQGEATGSYNVSRHGYLMGGYKTNPIGPGYIDAQILLRSDLKNQQSFDFNARYMLTPYKTYGGITYRTSDCIAVMLGMNPYTNLTIGYSYDLTLSKLSGASRGSHEVLIKYIYFLPVPPPTVTRNPRWL